jgi:hypothetical protein
MALLQMPSCFAQYIGRGHQLAKRDATSRPPSTGASTVAPGGLGPKSSRVACSAPSRTSGASSQRVHAGGSVVSRAVGGTDLLRVISVSQHIGIYLKT